MEQELDSHRINKYVEGLHKLSIITGKLDAVILYLEQIKPEDKFLSSSLDSILKDILEINGNKEYIRMNLGSYNITSKVELKNESIHDTNDHKEQLNAKQVQMPQSKIQQPLKPIVEVIDNKQNKSIVHIFKNSTNLARVFHGTEDISFLKTLGIELKNNETLIMFQNGRKYIYKDIPENKIETLITCDKNNISPGRYFNSEIRSNYECREVSHDSELVG